MRSRRNGIIKYRDGTRRWYQNDKLHREDGPAVIYLDGTRGWCQNDERHREDGPAVIFADGCRAWWLNDKQYTEEEYNIELRLRRCGLSTKVPYKWKSTVDVSA